MIFTEIDIQWQLKIAHKPWHECELDPVAWTIKKDDDNASES